MNAGEGWLGRLKKGLGRSSAKIADGIAGLFAARRIDKAELDKLEEVLIAADIGVAVSSRLVASLGKAKMGKDTTSDEVRAHLARDISAILAPVAKPLAVDAARKPHVVLVCGVNGSGKTTTVGKLAGRFRKQGLKVLIAAGDTFRAAAIEQLKVWGERADVPVIAGEQGGDAAALAFSALEKAKAEAADVLLIDTAGRLHNKSDLMAELQKIVRVIRKLDASAPHDFLLVMDATIGQNALVQVQTFKDMTDVTGLVMTKLDGSAKGGVVVALAEKFALPIHAVGVGEGMGDLNPFDADAFARSLMGLEG